MAGRKQKIEKRKEFLQDKEMKNKNKKISKGAPDVEQSIEYMYTSQDGLIINVTTLKSGFKVN